MLHQGNLLKEKVKELRPNLDLFAAALGMTRQNLYNVYGRSQIDFITLEKACEYLKIDEALFDQKTNKLKKDVNTSDKSISIEAYEEIKATLEKVEKEKDRLYNLLENMSNNYSGLLKQFESLKKHSGVENLRGERALNC